MAQTVAVVRASLSDVEGGSGTTDFVKTGFGDPDFVMFIWDTSNGTNNPQTNSGMGVGFWDRTNSRGIGGGATDNSDTTITYRSSDDAAVVVVPGDGSTLTYTASAITDGVRLTLASGTTGVQRFCTALFLKGIDAAVGTFTPNATQNATQASASLGLAPKLIFFIGVGASPADQNGVATCLISFGVAADSGPTQRNLIHCLGDNQASEVANVHFSTTRCTGQSSGDAAQWAGEVTTFGADTFTMTTRDGGTGSDVVFYAALGGADLSYDLGTLTSRTTTGDDVNATDITPAAILLAFSTAASTSIQTAASGANSLMFGMADADGQFSHNMSSQDAASISDNNSRSTANKLLSIDTSTGSGPTLFIEGTVAFNANDFTMSYPSTVNGTARLGWWVVFADNGDGTVTGSAANTLGDLTSDASGSYAHQGTGANTLEDLISAGTGSFGPVGSAANTLEDLISAGSGSVGVSGSASPTLGDLVSDGMGTFESEPGGGGVTGMAANTLGDLVSAGSGTVGVSGTAAITLGDLISEGTAYLHPTGYAANTLGDLSSGGVGTFTGLPSIEVEEILEDRIAVDPRLPAANPDYQRRWMGDNFLEVQDKLRKTTFTIDLDTTEVITVGSTLDQPLKQWTLPENFFILPGQVLRVHAHGTMASNVNNKTLRVKFGGTTLVSKQISGNDKHWWLDATITCITSTSQRYSGEIRINGEASTIGAGTLAIAASGEITIEISGQPATVTSGEITLQFAELQHTLRN